ncbi:MAG: glycosyltransferase family 2 protein, partial [Candidatus Ventricola sp.]
MNENNTLYIVVPCYKEQEVLPETSRRLKEKVLALRAQGKISDKSRIMFVNDGSSDNTWPIISQLHEQEPDIFSGVNLSRNRGHQNALLAGLLTAVNYADMIISMDADLQDDINAVDAMVSHYHEGYEVVYGVRSKRDTDTFFKRFTAEGFYKVMKALGVDIVFNHADYRLMSRRAVEGLAQFEEVNLFLRGIVPQIGYKWTTVTYERAERFAGESKYPLKKMLA